MKQGNEETIPNKSGTRERPGKFFRRCAIASGEAGSDVIIMSRLAQHAADDCMKTAFQAEKKMGRKELWRHPSTSPTMIPMFLSLTLAKRTLPTVTLDKFHELSAAQHQHEFSHLSPAVRAASTNGKFL